MWITVLGGRMWVWRLVRGWWLWVILYSCYYRALYPNVTGCVWFLCVVQDDPPTPCLSSTRPDFLRHCNQSASLWSVMRWCICTGSQQLRLMGCCICIQRFSSISEWMERAQNSWPLPLEFPPRKTFVTHILAVLQLVIWNMTSVVHTVQKK